MALALCALPGASLGHGDAQWIADGAYTGDDGVHCCGPADCEAIPAEWIEERSDGWFIKRHVGFHDGKPYPASDQFFADEGKGHYRSERGEFFWCAREYDRHIRCLFTRRTGV